ncbi:MAG: RNA 2',3'-cyclic phosphodiesterase [Anaerolineales bacterium]|nr:RNA 2',3'-cyclic phosphodiesterase [Anaerolineales bacterium]
MNPIRAFIAIDLPPSLQKPLERQISRLRKALGDDFIRWVPIENMHLTVKFLGNIAAAHLEFIKQMMTQAADSTLRFDLTLNGLGSFPNPNRIRILWAGVHAGSGLASLQREIELGAERLGFERGKRPFSPHLTIGRVRQGTDAKDMRKISDALNSQSGGEFASAKINSVHLYQSDLRADGSVYTKLHSASMR